MPHNPGRVPFGAVLGVVPANCGAVPGKLRDAFFYTPLAQNAWKITGRGCPVNYGAPRELRGALRGALHKLWGALRGALHKLRGALRGALQRLRGALRGALPRLWRALRGTLQK
jgi:hypothetical protein